MKTVVIVDDHEDNRALLMATLEPRDYRLVEASSGEEALKLIGKEEPDLIIADVLMPRMDGYEFVQQLRQDPRNAQTKVIFYTASYIEEESRRLAKACGVNHIIVKPTDPDTVLEIVDEALGRGRNRARLFRLQISSGNISILLRTSFPKRWRNWRRLLTNSSRKS